MKRLGVRDDVALMAGYHSPQVEAHVRLNTNESPVPPPAAWRDALATELARLEWNRYPDRDATGLRVALAEQYGVEPTMVFAANGSNEILQTLLLAYGGPGRSAAVFEPTYALHSHIARLTGTRVLSGERDADFALDAIEVDRVLGLDPDLVFLCSPNNPTGIVEPQALVHRVVDWAADRGALVIVDEAYGQFSPWSAIASVDDANPVVVTRTFSKTWSMAGARLGYTIAPTWVVQALEAVALPYHLDSSKQTAGRLALRFGDEMRDRVDQLVAERERVASELDLLGLEHWPSGANFVLFRPKNHRGADVWQSLLDQGVLVRNCASWPRLEDCLRVTIGTVQENDAFLRTLNGILNT